MDIYQRMCKNVIMPIGDVFTGLNVSKKFREIQQFQWLGRTDIENYQNRRFADLIDFVWRNVPFYRKYFQKNSLHPSDFKDLSDISKLPIITKETVRKCSRELKASNFQDKIIEMKSSGSTGEQTTVIIDNLITSDVLSTQLLFYSWGGFYMGGPHLQTGMSLEREILKRIKDILFRCRYVSAFGLSDRDLKRFLGIMKNDKIQYLLGYASSLYLLARYAKQNNFSLTLKKVYSWGDCLFPHYREEIEMAFRAKVADCYGLGEGLQIACQCGEHENMHIAEHNVYVEIIDMNGDKSKTLGERRNGRVIVTRFEPGPMPLIRYDTGDVSAFPSGSCKCGRKLKLLCRVLGRDADIIRSPKGDRLIVHFFTQLFETIPEIVQFQVRQNRLDRLEIFYVPGAGFNKRILETVIQKIQEHSLYKFDIRFVEVDRIPLEKSNKRRFVISSVVKEHSE